MSCPICGDLCRCAEPRTYVSRAMQLAEIDEYDPSEEQFASSLAGRDHDDEVQELSSGTLSSARQRLSRELPDVEVPVAEPDLHLTSVAVQEESWRNEVSSRIQNYKARRRRSLGSESLSFNFESTAGNHVFLRPEREPEPEPPVASEPDPLSAYYAHPYATAPAMEQYAPVEEEIQAEESVPEPPLTFEPEPPSVPETAKLIFFPKPPMMQEAPPDQLAEPVFDVPRIMEATESVETVAVPLADITLQSEFEEHVPAEPILDLPAPVAPVAQRIVSEAMDVFFVIIATVVFGMIANRVGASSIAADKRSLLEVAVTVPAAFWAIYKYIFLVYSGSTPGMTATRLRLADFQGETPTARVRRWRALAMLVSAFPLGLGLFWSFVDPETLCWHDRISKTYVTGR
jgi:uncharacterized RDD family membrane protein YckC